MPADDEAAVLLKKREQFLRLANDLARSGKFATLGELEQHMRRQQLFVSEFMDFDARNHLAIALTRSRSTTRIAKIVKTIDRS